MTRLTDAIKRRDTKYALDLINNEQRAEQRVQTTLELWVIYILNLFAALAIKIGLGDYKWSVHELDTKPYIEIEDNITHSPPLHLAADVGNLVVAEALMDRGASFPKDSCVIYGSELLDMAIINQEPPRIRKLVSAGVKLDFGGYGGHCSHLLRAVKPGYNFAVIQELLNGGAKLHATCDALITTDFDRDPKVRLKDYVNYPERGYPNKPATKEYFTIDGLQPMQNITALFFAVQQNTDTATDLITFLCKAGASPNFVAILSGRRYTPFSLALEQEKYSLAVEMMRNGASLDAQRCFNEMKEKAPNCDLRFKFDYSIDGLAERRGWSKEQIEERIAECRREAAKPLLSNELKELALRLARERNINLIDPDAPKAGQALLTVAKMSQSNNGSSVKGGKPTTRKRRLFGPKV